MKTTWILIVAAIIAAITPIAMQANADPSATSVASRDNGKPVEVPTETPVETPTAPPVTEPAAPPVDAPAPAPTTPVATPPKPVSGNCTPAGLIGSKNWKLQLPTGAKEKPSEIKQPEFATFKVDPWFTMNADCTAVQFRAAVNGVTTKGSNYPRSELREMNGAENAAWSSATGTHTLVINQAITKLPAEKSHLVAGQIHGGEDDVTVFRLEGTSLYVTDGDNAHHKLITNDYKLGTKFEAKFVVSGGKIQAYYNGQLQTTLTKKVDTAYFKAGAYTQANCTNSAPCAESNYGQVEIYQVTATHS